MVTVPSASIVGTKLTVLESTFSYGELELTISHYSQPPRCSTTVTSTAESLWFFMTISYVSSREVEPVLARTDFGPGTSYVEGISEYNFYFFVFRSMVYGVFSYELQAAIIVGFADPDSSLW